MAMLARRGFDPSETRPDLPFPPELSGEACGRLTALLGHYAFRLFLRGAIQRPGGFSPGETTRFVVSAQTRTYAAALVELGCAERLRGGRYRLRCQARSFGGALEWYVSRELVRRFNLDVACGVKLQSRGLGGDFDIVAAGEGRLIYLELKSSPPRNLEVAEFRAFFDRLDLLHPDVGIFVVDTALRLSDKVLPMLLAEMDRRRGGAPPPPVLLGPELWALTPHLYAVNGRRDLMANIGKALAAGIRALAPQAYW